jgi:hypothetical protein
VRLKVCSSRTLWLAIVLMILSATRILRARFR